MGLPESPDSELFIVAHSAIFWAVTYLSILQCGRGFPGSMAFRKTCSPGTEQGSQGAVLPSGWPGPHCTPQRCSGSVGGPGRCSHLLRPSHELHHSSNSQLFMTVLIAELSIRRLCLHAARQNGSMNHSHGNLWSNRPAN